MILTLFIKKVPENAEIKKVRSSYIGKINLIDLAASDRVSNVGEKVSNDILLETQYVNLSLLALGNFT